MSYQASNWAIEQVCDTATEKAVLMIIASYAGPDGTLYPSQETIARQSCCSVKTVERALKTFEERGWIERTERRRHDGSRTSDLIFMVKVANPEPREQPDNVSGSRGTTRHPVQTKQTSCPILTDTVSGLTTFEPVTRTYKNKPRDRELFEEAFSAFPESGRQVTDEPLARAAWDAAAKDVDEETLLEAVRAFAAAPVPKKRDLVPSMNRWLSGKRYLAFLDKAEAPLRSASTWAGPADLRAAVAAESGEGMAANYIDPAGWEDGEIIARTTYGAEKLRALRSLSDVTVRVAEKLAA